MLKVTKAKVCASIEVGRSFLDVARGMSTHESRSCGMKARDSSRRIDEDGNTEVRYSCVLYGLKLCRWSMRVTWWKYVCVRKGVP